MNNISGHDGFAEYRAIGFGVAIMPSVSVVIPAKNEARNLEHVFGTIPDWVNEIVLVDGNSTDDAIAVARQLNPGVVVVKQTGRGKGDALQAGFAAARGEIIVMMDADGSMSPEEIPHYVYFLEQGYDFVKGSRFVAGGGSLDITAMRRAGNRMLLAVANILYGAQFSDLCYGFFGFRREFLEHLALRFAGF